MSRTSLVASATGDGSAGAVRPFADANVVAVGTAAAEGANHVDLPTYTNIWRIEKRLYKLYDFRLPAPLPISWIAVFAGILVPYVLILTAAGLPFSHNLVWLYVLPPGILTWLTTRPVLENKRLPELLLSQIRYFTEPRTWCRLAPLHEKDEISVSVRVWHAARPLPRSRTAPAAIPGGDGGDATAGPPSAAAASARVQSPAPPSVAAPRQAVGPAPRPAVAGTVRATCAAPGDSQGRDRAAPIVRRSDTVRVADRIPPHTARPFPGAAAASTVNRLPGVSPRPAPPIKRALNRPADGVVPHWRRRVAMTPGDQDGESQQRAALHARRIRLPLNGPRRIVVLGCISGAGQTTTTLLVGRTLAAVRGVPVAAVDLHPDLRDLPEGTGPVHVGLARLAGIVPSGTVTDVLAGEAGAACAAAAPEGRPSAHGPAGLHVIAAGDHDDPAVPTGELDHAALVGRLARWYPLVVVDPGASDVTRVLPIADQLVLVVPPTRDAPRALTMTFEWLRDHGHGPLAARAVTVVNGVGRRVAAEGARAEAVARRRCRAIVRVPWDEALAVGRAELSALEPATWRAHVALAGVLVAGLAAVDALRGDAPPTVEPPPAQRPPGHLTGEGRTMGHVVPTVPTTSAPTGQRAPRSGGQAGGAPR